MSHRTQVTFTDEQYEWLREESTRTGRSIAEIVRQAIVSVNSAPSAADRDETLGMLRRTAGAWKDRDFDGAEYVERIRPRGIPWREAADGADYVERIRGPAPTER